MVHGGKVLGTGPGSGWTRATQEAWGEPGQFGAWEVAKRHPLVVEPCRLRAAAQGLRPRASGASVTVGCWRWVCEERVQEAVGPVCGLEAGFWRGKALQER